MRLGPHIPPYKQMQSEDAQLQKVNADDWRLKAFDTGSDMRF